MRMLISSAIVGLLLVQPISAQTTITVETPPADQGVGERVGESVDRGLTNLGNKIRKTWADFRKSVDELSVQGRVYGRLRWDKTLATAPIEITVQNENVVTLAGNVPSETARRTAVMLANDTVGVRQVVDHLTVATVALPTTALPPSTPSTPAPQ